MALTRSNKLDKLADNIEATSNVTELNVTHKNLKEGLQEEENWQEDPEAEQYSTEEADSFDQNQDCDPEEYEGQYEGESSARDFSQNQISISFSWSLMNQIRYLARSEGINVEDLLIELVSEGVTKRAFEDQKPVPSHLMTRNGYVHNDPHTGLQQPQMSHHAMNNNRAQNGQTNRNKPGIQMRNGQYNNTSRYQNPQNRNYQGNNNRNNQQPGNPTSFRQNNNSYNNNTQRYAPRSNSSVSNYPTAQQGNQSGNQQQCPVNDNSESNHNGHNTKNKKY